MVGAAAGDLERARPILEAMGNKIIHCGPQGSGISMKIVNNFLAMATCQISAEALTLGSKLGLSTATMYEVITNSLASNDHLKTYWPTKVLKGDVEPGFRRRSCLQGSLDRGERGGAGRRAGLRPARRRGNAWPRRAPATGSVARTSPPSCSRQRRMPASSRRGFRPLDDSTIGRTPPHPFTAPADRPSTT